MLPLCKVCSELSGNLSSSSTEPKWFLENLPLNVALCLCYKNVYSGGKLLLFFFFINASLSGYRKQQKRGSSFFKIIYNLYFAKINNILQALWKNKYFSQIGTK